LRDDRAARVAKGGPRELIVGEVSLRDVRSYPALELALEPGLVLVTGPNGAGKTNLLEAVHVATQGVSFRTRHDAQIVGNGAAAARVAARGVRGRVDVRVEVTLSREAPKRIRLDGATLASAEELRRKVHTLVFTPDRLAVGGEDERVHLPAKFLGGREGRAEIGRAHV